ncbi:MAG: hypothetical protein HDQ44_02015 [Desulfovibrio sp.]|nr:hypothetical protein [Desulfovibrio sp.]
MDIAATNKNILRSIADSGRCRGCPLAGKTRVGMDASGNEPGERPILFIGLNPGREEAEKGLPFVGKAGRFLRQCMADAGYGENPGWAMINSILCSTSNESAIPNVEACQKHCHANVAAYVIMLRPKIIAPCGNGASAIFGLGSGITANAKRSFISRGPAGKASPVLVLPLVHPSSLIRNGGKSAPGYADFMKRLREILEAATTFDPAEPDSIPAGCATLFGQHRAQDSHAHKTAQ